ncbi:hypothetical protein PTI98_013481 [Pleurotus ostreatus]|nr:hypothetical protein PTI98_013481 [Pleurotus ostreatus]
MGIVAVWPLNSLRKDSSWVNIKPMQADHPGLSSDSDAASDVDELSGIDLSLPGPNASPRTLRKRLEVMQLQLAALMVDKDNTALSYRKIELCMYVHIFALLINLSM